MTARISTALLTLALFVGCNSGGKASGTREGSVEARALVVAIDVPQRKLTLKDEDGLNHVVIASSEVRNLEQIKAGDQVAITYNEKVSWQVKSPDKGAPGGSAEASLSRSKAGEKPAGMVGAAVTMTATITAIDLNRGTVTITGPKGNRLTLLPRDPANLKKAEVGDLIDISYSATLVVAVRPVESNK
jgi:hypothetical protein